MIGDTADINLLTGLPGSGKSLRLIEAILDAQQNGWIVFVCNINGINVPGVVPWEDPTKWEEVPAGGILFVDEAQQFFPTRRSGDPLPHIKAMSTIRHKGIRLVLATQQPDYLDSYLRGLVGFHEHLYRVAGREVAFIFRNHQLMDQVRASLKRIKATYDHEKWNFPKHLFAYYKSAEIHTRKYVMPALAKRVALGAIVAGLLFLGPIGYLGYRALAGKEEADAAAAAGTSPPASAADASSRPQGKQTPGSPSVPLTPEQYVESLLPRVAHIPSSAPLYDSAKGQPKSLPELYCMAAGAGEDANGDHLGDDCTCMTEQGTAYALDQQTCFVVVEQGGVYNPYREPPPRNQPQSASPVALGAGHRPADMAVTTAAPVRAGGGYGEVAQYGQHGLAPE